MNQQSKSLNGERTVESFVFVGLNRRVLALDRYSGDLIWEWKATQGSGFVSLLLDGDRLIAAVNGYVYCLDPLYGQEIWQNPLKGYGLGVSALVTVRGSSGSTQAAQIAQQQAAASAAAAG